MKKCDNCGCENPDNSKFCQECGCKMQTQQFVCPQCGAKFDSLKKFCSECGAVMEVVNPILGGLSSVASSFLDSKAIDFDAIQKERDDAAKKKEELKKLRQSEAELESIKAEEAKRKALEEEERLKNFHESVNLGLSVRWATCNIGASSPGDYGDFFAWGETSPKSRYTKGTYDPEGDGVNGDDGLGADISGTRYDVARTEWGEKWRMPNRSEFMELVKKCEWMKGCVDGHNGYFVKGPNGNKIFLPATGKRDEKGVSLTGSGGCYWTSCKKWGFEFRIIKLIFANPALPMLLPCSIADGRAVRAVTIG